MDKNSYLKKLVQQLDAAGVDSDNCIGVSINAVEGQPAIITLYGGGAIATRVYVQTPKMDAVELKFRSE